MSQQNIIFDRFVLDPEQKSVSGPDGPIALRPQTFAVLCHLIEKAPAVVSRDELLDAVWGHQSTSISSVAQTIKELRQALGDSSSSPRLIVTRRRLGYQFIADIETPVPASPTKASIPSPDPGPPADRYIPKRNRTWPLLLALAAMVLLAAVWQLQPSAPSASQSLPTLAISDMVNSSDDPELNWLAPALGTYLGHALVELGGFRVLALDHQEDPELSSADYVIEGQYLSAGVDGSRFLARLRRPGSNEVIGSLESESAGWDVSQLTIAMAGAIRDRLGFSAPPQSDASTLSVRLPNQADSQRAFFKAQAALDAFNPGIALSELEQALVSQPDSPQLQMLKAQALASLGDVESARAMSEQALAPTGLWPRRDRLQLEATAAMLSFDFDRAADQLQAVNQFYPEPASSRQLVFALIQSGRLNAARDALNSLRTNRPDDPRLALLGAELARVERDHDERLIQARQASELAQVRPSPGLLVAARLIEADALIRTGLLDQAGAIYQQLTTAELPISDADVAKVRLGQARIEFQQGRYESALELADQAETGFDAIPHPEGLADTHSLRASAHDRAGRLDDAVASLDRAMVELETLADPRRLAQVGVLYGITLMRAREFEAAEARLDESARYFRTVRDRQGEGAALINLGNVIANTGRITDSEPVFQRALEAFEDAGDLRGQAIVLGNLAAIATQRRDVSQAVSLSEQALGMFELIGARTDIARVSYNLGLTHRRQGDLQKAEARIQQAADAFAEQGAVMMQMRALTSLANLLVDMGRSEALEAVFDTIDSLGLDNPDEQTTVAIARGRQALFTGELTAARTHFERALRLAEESESVSARNRARLNMARLDVARGQPVAAEQSADALRAEFVELRDSSGEIDALIILAHALFVQDREADAARNLSAADELLAESPDAHQALEIAIIRSKISTPELARQRLDWVVETADQQGYKVLGDQARNALGRL